MSKKPSKINKQQKEQLTELYAEALDDFKEFFKETKKSLRAKKKKAQKKPGQE